jgi:hypothetical protein
MEAAFSKANLVTLVGSIIPLALKLTISPVYTSTPIQLLPDSNTLYLPKIAV